MATGKQVNFTRSSINGKIASLSVTAGSSVTRKTDYLICGEKPGSKLEKEKEMLRKIETEYSLFRYRMLSGSV